MLITRSSPETIAMHLSGIGQLTATVDGQSVPVHLPGYRHLYLVSDYPSGPRAVVIADCEQDALDEAMEHQPDSYFEACDDDTEAERGYFDPNGRFLSEASLDFIRIERVSPSAVSLSLLSPTL